jgi:hypothetical protein
LLIPWKLQSTFDWNKKKSIYFISKSHPWNIIEDIGYKRKENGKSYLFLTMERKRKALSLETKYNILWEIEKESNNKAEIAKDFQIQMNALGYYVLKRNKLLFFPNQMLFKMADDGKQ